MTPTLGSLRRPAVASTPPTRPEPAGAEVDVEHVSKGFGTVTALSDVSMKLARGEFVALTGRSGSGKSTLLNVIGGLDHPESGRVLVDGMPVHELEDPAVYRREIVGFVFQLHHLLPELTARQNVEVALLGAGVGRSERRERALGQLAEVGLANRAEHLPAQLSGGERQRVAIARALVNEPRLLLADEPTGALDSTTGERVLNLMVQLRERRGMTALVVSYDPAVRAHADRTLTLIDGRLEPA